MTCRRNDLKTLADLRHQVDELMRRYTPETLVMAHTENGQLQPITFEPIVVRNEPINGTISHYPLGFTPWTLFPAVVYELNVGDPDRMEIAVQVTL